MATLQQIYQAYLNEDPNVSQMTYYPHGWNIEQTFDDTTTTDTTDTLPATGGITSAYYPQGGDGGAFDYLQNPVDPVSLGFYDKSQGYTGGLPGDVTQVGPGRQFDIDDPLAYGTDEEEVKFLDSPFGWAKQKWGNLTPGQQKTGIIGASSFLPFPLNVAAAATQFLSKGEGYAVGGLDAYEKGIYNTLAGKRMLYKDPGTGLLKDIRGKNVYSLAGDYEEGLEDEYNEYMERYGGRKKFYQLVKEGKIKSKYITDTVDVYDNVFGYLDKVKENQKKEIDRIQKKIDDELKGKIVPPGPHGEPYDAPDITPVDTPISIQVPRHISQPDTPVDTGGGGYTGAGTQAPGSAAAGPMSGGYGPWSKAKGGLIRKKYGTGGIVDLL